jgi:hypothetical protein
VPHYSERSTINSRIARAFRDFGIYEVPTPVDYELYDDQGIVVTIALVFVQMGDQLLRPLLLTGRRILRKTRNGRKRHDSRNCRQ